MQAYQGQAPFIKTPGGLQGRDLDPPGRGASRRLDPQIAGTLNPAPEAFNPALTKNQVLAAVTATGFITG